MRKFFTTSTFNLRRNYTLDVLECVFQQYAYR